MINVLFGLPTHSCIIWLIITRGGIASEFFILNLSICEIGNCVSCIFAVLIHWILSLKTLALTLFGLFFAGRPLFHCLMCVERYLAVVHPVTFLKYKPLRYKGISSAAAWIVCLGSCLCCLLLFEYYMIAYMVLFSTMFILFLSIQLLCCLAVLRALKQSGPGERGREREEENHMKRRAFHLILITTVSMVIAYIPYAVLGFFAVMTSHVIKVFWLIGLICFVLCGFVQPVLYLNRAGKLNCLCST
ncbi:G-protein coupled receptor 4-like [Triplophysa rosa]|uniref:G-protein coupled receptor 4-like n=1 Tax=Triplophysa rosa TaxID=992332 RepID=UPI002546307C|nr:G-protein coupled receptor 4-like [Triplophysa rosa]